MPGSPPFVYRDVTPGTDEVDWKPGDDVMRVGADKVFLFRTTLTIEFVPPTARC